MTTYPEASGDVMSAAAGDRDAFVRLVQKYATTVNSIALAIVRDVHASQDIAQDVFLVAWKDLGKLRSESSFLPWIRQITRNRANEWLRERSRITDRDADAILAATVDPARLASDLLEQNEQQRVVAEVIDSLPDESREVITLFYNEGRSVRQVSDLLGIREDAVKKRLSRARERIREELLEQFGEVMKKRAPAAAIAAAVSATLMMSTPAAAATTSMGAAKVFGGSLVGKIAAGASGAFLGAFLGSAGVMSGVRRNMEQSIDEEERGAWRRFGRVGVSIVIAASLGIALSGLLRSAILLIVVQTLFVGSLGWMYVRWVPRIMKRRVDYQLANDPAAAQRLLRARVISFIGLGVGIVASTVTVIFAVTKLLP